MKIQNIKTAIFNQHQTQNNQKIKKNDNNQTFSQIDKLPSVYYVPFCGQNKTIKAIDEILNDENFDIEQKFYLQFLTLIDDFSEAAKGMDKRTLQTFLMLAQEYRPAFEDVLKGNYVASYGEVNKPLIDLKSIADYNKKRPTAPLDLFNCVFGDVLISKFLNCMKMLNKDRLDTPSSFEYEINGEPFKTTIKYQQKSISEEKINQLKNAPINPLIKEYLSYKSTPLEIKQIMWELSEIPYFNYIIKDISLDELDTIVDLTKHNKIFITELLKGNVYHFDKKRNKEKPLINLKEAAINNYKENLSNQKDIFKLFLNNNLILRLHQKIMRDRYKNKRYPEFLYSYDMHTKSNFISFTTNEKRMAFEAFESMKGPNTPMNHFIIFKNDLNELEAKTENISLRSKEEEQEIQEEILLDKRIFEERKNYKTPQVVFDYLKDSDIDNSLKKIVYNFAEEIPYFNYLMRNADIENLETLVELRTRNPKLFDMLINGKICIINDGLFGAPMIDLEEMVLKEGSLSSVIYKNSLAYDIILFMTELEEKDNIFLENFSVNRHSTNCKSILDYLEENCVKEITIVLKK